MQPRQRGVHGVVDRGALGRRGPRHVRLPDHAALDMRHQVERRAGDIGVVAVDERRGHREALRVERGDHPVLAIDGVRGRQQLARRLAPQHVAARGRRQEIGGIGLAALELAQLERAVEIGQARGEKGFEPRGIDGEPGGDVLGAGKCGLAIDRGHGDRVRRAFRN